MTAQPGWWNARWFLVALVLCSAIPLLVPDVPPLIDLPGHMARYRVQLDGGRTPWFADWYRFEWRLIGNLGVDLLIVPMAKIFGLELGVKLIVLAIPPMTVAGMLWIAQEVHGRVPPTALFALPLAYAAPFQLGFVNFALSMALALIAFALWLRMGDCRARAWVFVPVAIVIWLTHAFGWGVLGLLAFASGLVRQRDAGRTWISASLRAAISCLPMALPLLLMIAWRSDAGGQTEDWFNWGAKYLWLIMALRDRWELFDIASLVAMLAVLVIGFANPAYRYVRLLAVPSALLIAVYLLLPRIVFASAYADMRLLPFALAVAILALGPKSGMTPRAAGLIALAGLAFFGVRIASNTASFWLYDRAYDRELAVLNHVPEGARLVGFTSAECRLTWATNRFEHLPAMALVRRAAYTNDQWIITGAALLTVTYRGGGAFTHDASQITTAEKCPFDGWRQIDEALTTFPRDAFDYVWLIDPPAYDPANLRGLTAVWRDGTSMLLRVDRPLPAATATP